MKIVFPECFEQKTRTEFIRYDLLSGETKTHKIFTEYCSLRNLPVANLLGNRLTVPNANQGMSAMNIKAEPADRDTASPNSRSSISPTSPYQVQRRIVINRDDRDMDKDGAPKRPRLDGPISAANGWR